MDLSKFKTTSDVVVDDTDSLGGGYTLESGVYPMTIDMVYLDETAKGAISMNCVFKNTSGQTLRHTFWIQSGAEKNYATTYVDKRTGEKHLLPGLNQANALVELTLGKQLSDLNPEEKTINLYNHEAGAEIPTKVQVLLDMLNRDVILGVQKKIEPKNVKGDDGLYHPDPTGATRTINEVAKIFQAGTGLTVGEIKAGETTGKFLQSWEKKWKDVTIDKSVPASKKPAGGAAGVGAVPTPVSSAGSLFPEKA